MAKRLGSVYVPKTSARVVQRPDSIPGMEDTPATVSVTVSQTAVSVTGTGPVTRSTSTISHSATPSLNSLSPDGYELTDAVNICGPEVGKELEPSSTEIFECAICLQTCVHPVRLPCSHIFCFLCIKGVAIQSKRCALCRQDIPVEFCSDPALLRKEDLLKELVFEGGYQWYYQGMNGWWQYDERTSTEIEEHYKLGEKTLEMLIAGFLYIIDFDNMLQYRRNDPTRRRKIKRDLITIPDRKGVAGLKILSPANDSPHRLDGDGGENVPCVVQQGRPSRTTRPVNRRSRRSPATSPRAPQSSPEENTADSYSSPTDAPSPDLENQDLTAQIGGLSLLDDNGNSAEQSTVYDQTRPMRSVTTEVQSTADPHISDDDEWE